MAGKEVKIGNVEIPAFSARPTRIGATGVGIVALLLGGVLFFNRDSADNPLPDIAKDPRNSRITTPRPSPPGTEPAITWYGTMILADGRGVDVGNEPLTVGGITGSSFYLFYGYIEGGGSNILSEWTADTAPVATDCATQLRTRPIDKLRPQAGLHFCTHGYLNSRVAYVQIISFDAASSSADIDVTIWDLQL